MSPFFIIPIIAYVIFFILIGIAYLLHLIETSEDERDKWREPWHIRLIFCIVLMFWPLLGLPMTLSANDDKHLDWIEAIFIILELMFWVPIIGFFVQLWLF